MVVGCLATVASTPMVNMAWRPVGQHEHSSAMFRAYATVNCAGRCQSYELHVLNSSDEPLEIVWDKTQFIVGQQTVSGFIWDGIKFMEKDQPRGTSVVLPRGTFVRTISPSSLVRWESAGRYSAWVMDALPTGVTGIFLTIRQQGREEFATLLFETGADLSHPVPTVPTPAAPPSAPPPPADVETGGWTY